MKTYKLFISIIFIFVLVLSPPHLLSGEEINYRLNSRELKQGEILSLEMESGTRATKIFFMDEKYKTREYSGEQIALIPVSYWVSPGTYELVIHSTSGSHREKIKILSGDFEESHLEVDKDKEEMVKPQTEETKEKREQDQELIYKALSDSSKNKLWQSRFITPLEGKTTTTFGAERYVNGELQSRHSGIDIAAPEGEKIKATAAGRVTLAKELLVTGNTVLIDHGLDVFSSYAHLKNIRVEKGQTIEQGDVIGTVGSTGFSTGPHLHWSIRLQGVFINPKQFTDKDLLK
ncbi:MAG: M23 family metallopeptidase [Halanaerobiales bacterium]